MDEVETNGNVDMVKFCDNIAKKNEGGRSSATMHFFSCIFCILEARYLPS
jgi:hypothetical protein